MKKEIPTKDIYELKNQLIEEKNKNQILEYELEDLKNKINKLTQDINNIIKKYQSDMNKMKEKNKELEKLIEKQKQEIDDYKFKLNILSKSNQAISVKPGD